MVMFGLATTRLVAYSSALLIIPSSMRGPTLQAFATAAVAPDEQGALMVRTLPAILVNRVSDYGMIGLLPAGEFGRG